MKKLIALIITLFLVPVISHASGILGDVNNDGVVDILDLSLMARNWGRTGENVADLNNDGVVDILDLSIMAKDWGRDMDDSVITHSDQPAPVIEHSEPLVVEDIVKKKPLVRSVIPTKPEKSIESIVKERIKSMNDQGDSYVIKKSVPCQNHLGMPPC